MYDEFTNMVLKTYHAERSNNIAVMMVKIQSFPQSKHIDVTRDIFFFAILKTMTLCELPVKNCEVCQVMTCEECVHLFC